MILKKKRNNLLNSPKFSPNSSQQKGENSVKILLSAMTVRRISKLAAQNMMRKTESSQEIQKDKISNNTKKNKLRHICERFCKDIDINIAFLPVKLSFFSCKNTLTKSLQSYVIYQFTCAGCKN